MIKGIVLAATLLGGLAVTYECTTCVAGGPAVSYVAYPPPPLRPNFDLTSVTLHNITKSNGKCAPCTDICEWDFTVAIASKSAGTVVHETTTLTPGGFSTRQFVTEAGPGGQNGKILPYEFALPCGSAGETMFSEVMGVLGVFDFAKIEVICTACPG